MEKVAAQRSILNSITAYKIKTGVAKCSEKQKDFDVQPQHRTWSTELLVRWFQQSMCQRVLGQDTRPLQGSLCHQCVNR